MKRRDEAWALGLLEQIIHRDREDRDALPGSVVKLVKQAAVILRKRRHSPINARRRRIRLEKSGRCCAKAVVTHSNAQANVAEDRARMEP